MITIDVQVHVPANTNNEVDFWLPSDVEVTVASCSPLQADLLPLLSLLYHRLRLLPRLPRLLLLPRLPRQSLPLLLQFIPHNLLRQAYACDYLDLEELRNILNCW